jgi:hypothetical protein
MDIGFKGPAQVGGSADLKSVQWALLLFSLEDRFEGSLSMPQGAEAMNVSVFTPSFALSPYASVERPIPRESSWSIPRGGLAARFLNIDIGALYVQANSINLSIDASLASFNAFPDGLCTGSLLKPEEMRSQSNQLVCHEGSLVGMRFDPVGGSVTLNATGVREMHLHNAAVECSGIEPGSCPAGGFRRNGTVAVAPGWTVTLSEYGIDQLFPFGESDASFFGTATAVILGSEALDLSVDGWIRLPLAAGEAACAACSVPQNQTLWASGNLTLAGLSVEGDGFRANLDGAVGSARFDESVVDGALLAGAGLTAAAAAGLLLVAKIVMGVLFTRLRGERALEHPNRRLLMEHITKDPGVNFRGLVRASGIAAGTARHHLTIMVRAGVVSEQGYGSTRRFFAGTVGKDWEQQVLLREPGLRQLRDWVASNPGATQLQVLDAMALAGWSRSTTQHRLLRLSESGALQVRWQGRYKRYWTDAASAPAEAAARAAATGSNVAG